MTFDWSFLEGAFRRGDWLVILVILISIGLSIAYSFLIFKLLNLRAITIPSRFTTDSPETVFERAWMDFLNAVTILFRGVVLAIFLFVGLYGALVVCYVLAYALAGRGNIPPGDVSQEGIWTVLFFLGVLPMTVVWLIALYTRDAGWGKSEPLSAFLYPEHPTTKTEDSFSASPRLLSCIRTIIKLGFAGWILAGAWILLAAGLVFIRAIAAAFTIGRMTFPVEVMALSFPTASGLLLIVSGGFLLFYFRIYLEAMVPSIELTQNFQLGWIYSLMVFGAVVTTAGVYHPWPQPIKTIVILILLASTFLFLLAAIDSVSIWTRLFSILFVVFFGMFSLSRTGLLIGALPVFFLLLFVYRIIPESLLVAREYRHRRSGATPGKERSSDNK